jgi:hypothetical protein
VYIHSREKNENVNQSLLYLFCRGRSGYHQDIDKGLLLQTMIDTSGPVVTMNKCDSASECSVLVVEAKIIHVVHDDLASSSSYFSCMSKSSDSSSYSSAIPNENSSKEFWNAQSSDSWLPKVDFGTGEYSVQYNSNKEGKMCSSTVKSVVREMDLGTGEYLVQYNNNKEGQICCGPVKYVPRELVLGEQSKWHSRKKTNLLFLAVSFSCVLESGRLQILPSVCDVARAPITKLVFKLLVAMARFVKHPHRRLILALKRRPLGVVTMPSVPN